MSFKIDHIRYKGVKRIFICLVAVFFMTVKTGGQKQSNQNVYGEVNTYCNARFGYCIDFPSKLLFAQTESQNGDGRVFNNKKGVKVLTVFGRHALDMNGDPLTLQKQFDNELKELASDLKAKNNITYKRTGKNFYVISGISNGNIFYHKTILKEGAFCFARLVYPQDEKNVYDAFTTILFKSFK